MELVWAQQVVFLSPGVHCRMNFSSSCTAQDNGSVLPSHLIGLWLDDHVALHEP